MAAMLDRLIRHGEGFLKGLLFDCRRCGQCVLRRTSFVCPMRCPKGLRNGPCGGTLDGRCEVDPTAPCIWVRIDGRRHGERLEVPPILPPLDESLREGASLVHACTGRDAGCRDPLPVLGRADASDPRPRTASRLEAALRAGRRVLTTEVHAPRQGDGASLVRRAAAWAGTCDAVNATAFLSGQPALPAGDLALRLQEAGIEAIAQATGRDLTMTTFRAELARLDSGGVANLLCLTGDRGDPRQRAVFHADASLLVHEARQVREHGASRDGTWSPSPRPRPFLGVAINHLSTPTATAVRRLLQKHAAGAEFAQTQPVFATAAFRPFWDLACQAAIPQKLHILAGLPLVTDPGLLPRLAAVPGMRIDPSFLARFTAGADPVAQGIAATLELGRELLALPGVAGLHLMRFGPDRGAQGACLAALRRLLDGLPTPRSTPTELPCPAST